jgi:hypothetical protein
MTGRTIERMRGMTQADLTGHPGFTEDGSADSVKARKRTTISFSMVLLLVCWRCYCSGD